MAWRSFLGSWTSLEESGFMAEGGGRDFAWRCSSGHPRWPEINRRQSEIVKDVRSPFGRSGIGPLGYASDEYSKRTTLWGSLCPKLMQLGPVLSQTHPREVAESKITGTEQDPVTTPSCGTTVSPSKDGKGGI